MTILRLVKEQQEKQLEIQSNKHCSWRDLVASDHSQPSHLAWAQEGTVFLTSKDAAIRKKHLRKSNFGHSSDARL